LKQIKIAHRTLSASAVAWLEVAQQWCALRALRRHPVSHTPREGNRSASVR
jgi:hypothetical protein